MMAASESEHNGTQAAVQQPSIADQLSDVQIAAVIEQAVRDVPGIAALSAGRLGAAATYGPGHTVHGVAVRRVQDDTFTVEVHLVVAGAELADIYADTLDEGQDADIGALAALPTLAEAIRNRLTGVLHGRGVPPLAAVDVYFDDWE
jgi:hypothetical protein